MDLLNADIERLWVKTPWFQCTSSPWTELSSRLCTGSLLRLELTLTTPEKVVRLDSLNTALWRQQRTGARPNSELLSRISKMKAVLSASKFIAGYLNPPSAKFFVKFRSLRGVVVSRLKSASNANAGAAAETLHSGFRLHASESAQSEQQLAKWAVLMFHNPSLFFSC